MSVRAGASAQTLGGRSHTPQRPHPQREEGLREGALESWEHTLPSNQRSAHAAVLAPRRVKTSGRWTEQEAFDRARLSLASV